MSVYVFLHDQYADWELGHLLPELRTPPMVPQIPKRPKQVATFGLSSRPVESMGGLRVTPHMCLDDVHQDDIEALVLPGGTFWAQFANEHLDALVRSTAARGVWVGAICAATAYIANLGLLDDVMHTSNGKAFLQERAPSYRGGALYRDELAVAHRNIVTASGLGAIEFTLQLIRALEIYPPNVCDIWFRAFKHGEDPLASRGQG